MSSNEYCCRAAAFNLGDSLLKKFVRFHDGDIQSWHIGEFS
jgi:hypothetical protein